jgi:hypothetical protein
MVDWVLLLPVSQRHLCAEQEGQEAKSDYRQDLAYLHSDKGSEKSSGDYYRESQDAHPVAYVVPGLSVHVQISVLNRIKAWCRYLVRGIIKTFGTCKLGMPENQRRAPARPKEIQEIDPKQDIRVRITGTVLSVDEDSISLDDGSGTVEVFLDQDQMEDLEENQRLRVFGRVLPTPDSFEIQGEIVQDFSDFDPELYSRVKKVVSTSE